MLLLPVRAGKKKSTVTSLDASLKLNAGRNTDPGIATFALVAASNSDTVVVSATMIHKMLKQ